MNEWKKLIEISSKFRIRCAISWKNEKKNGNKFQTITITLESRWEKKLARGDFARNNNREQIIISNSRGRHTYFFAALIFSFTVAPDSNHPPHLFPAHKKHQHEENRCRGNCTVSETLPLFLHASLNEYIFRAIMKRCNYRIFHQPWLIPTNAVASLFFPFHFSSTRKLIPVT